MLILVRKIRVHNDVNIDQRDVECEVDALRIGSGKDQDLQLFGEQLGIAHAVLRPLADGGLRIDCKGQCQVTVADRDVGHAEVGSGEWIRIGSHRLASVEAPPGFDAAIEVHIDINATATIADRLHDELTLKLPRLRRKGYVLALLVLVLGLAIPLAGYFDRDLGETLEAYRAPTDHIWSSGPLARVHHVPGVAESCNACHVKPFQRVRDDACLACHGETHGHFPVAHPVMAEFQDRCASCHREHKEPSALISGRQSLCTDCHAQPLARLVAEAPMVDGVAVVAAADSLRPVTAFSSDGHPEFMASLLRLSDDGWGISRERLDSDGLKESSNLKFPHDLHLDGSKVSLSAGEGTGRQLLCSDCHQLQRDGEHFQPITMEATCAGCHTLAFTDEQPGRELPHVHPERLLTYLEEFHVGEVVRQQAAPAQRRGPRRVPGATVSDPPCPGDALACGLERAAEAKDRLFTRAGCVSCHEVSRERDRWQVKPVRLVSNWYSQARFDHRPHLNPGLMGGDLCLGCHQAQASSHSHDVLMPNLETCVACHGEDRRGAVVLQCIDCHGFHRPGLTTMGQHTGMGVRP